MRVIEREWGIRFEIVLFGSFPFNFSASAIHLNFPSSKVTTTSKEHLINKAVEFSTIESLSF